MIYLKKKVLLSIAILLISACAAGEKAKELFPSQAEREQKLRTREQETGVQVARRAFVDSSQYVDGRFTVGTKQRQKLLYGFPNPNSTSHVIFNIDGFFASNEPNFQAFYLLGPQRIVDFSYEVSWTFRKMSIVQRLTPILKNGRGMVWIQYFFKNWDKVAHTVGTQLELDTMIGSNDAAPLASSCGIIERETQYEDEENPDFFQAYERVSDPGSLIGQGLLYCAGATPPDFMIAGDWGKLNSVRWDEYRASDRHYGDSAVLYRWNPRNLMPGDSLYIGTFYGLGSSFSRVFEDLVVRIAGPGEINQVANEYVPNPFEVIVTAINTGTIVLENLSANIKLPDGLQLVSGQTTPKDFRPQRLTKDKMSSVAWKVELTEQPTEPKLYEFSVEVSHAASRLEPVVIRGSIKFNPVFKIEPAQDIQLIMATRTSREVVTIGQLYAKVIDDETEKPIPQSIINMTGADTTYSFQTNLQGEFLLNLGRPVSNLTKFNYEIKVAGFLDYNKTEELGFASGDTAVKTFRLIRDTYELAGQLQSDKPTEVVNSGKLLLTNPDTTIWILVNEQGNFSHIMKKHQQPERNSYTITIYSSDHFLYIENIDFGIPRTFKQNRNFVLPYLQIGAKAILYNVFYEQNQYILPIQAFSELLRSCAYLNDHTNIVVEIGGHTSSPGSDTYNLWLSERRAEAALEFFKGLGIPVALLKPKGYGENFPIATNLTREGQTQNRRIELKVIEILQ